MVDYRQHLWQAFQEHWVPRPRHEFGLPHSNRRSSERTIQGRWRICFELVVMDFWVTVGILISLIEFSYKTVGDRVYLRYLMKGVVRFGKKGKLAPRYVGPFEIVECVGPVAYRLKLPQELSCVHDTFHVSNLKKCLAEPDVQVPLDEIEIDENL
ncbi:hypothetical protein Tco_0562303 [Tanacetum coccineum]